MPFAWPGLSWARLAWPGLAWLSAVGFYILFFWVKFMQMPKADGERSNRERERERGGKWATNALRNFRTK